MLFINYDQAKIWAWRKNRTSRADYNIHFTFCHQLPVFPPLSFPQVAVKHHNFRKPFFEAINRLGRKADFGYHHDGLSAIFNGSFDGFEVHFGFAASSNPMQKESTKLTRMNLVCNSLGNSDLFII